ncbi:hypothetical protein PPACK8108_LOCUS8345 [Phakopsora pachyrhizi]|uniref:MADS-box domain-containing protein n=1 Tax=Phakopsora pachyrhizi TaxID=170000 RepID=A0AAV0AX34_PHAPC|nr:hypothetical protein PPACK8108_LOCUS8345 [Phakopsora pachyrhizi]
MESTFGPTESCSSRPKRPLPTGSILPFVEKQSAPVCASPADLGGTLVPHAPEEIAELSSDSDEEDGSGAAGSSTKRRKGKSKSNLPRRQIKIEYIQDKSRRNITFGKRKNGIFKKAQEISTLTGCEVMLIVASKDSELQAFTYATTRLKPLVTEPASEAYIQNCLRYGALMPGAPSAINGSYGPGANNRQGFHISTLNAGPRASPVPIQNGASATNMYPFKHSNSISRRTLPFGLHQGGPMSPQSAGPNSISQNQTSRSMGLADDIKPESIGSPSQQVAPMSSGSQNSKSSWPTTSNVSIPPDLHASTSSIGIGNGVVPANREMLGEWNLAQPRHIYHSSPSLGAMQLSSRGLSPFQIPGSSTGNTLCYAGNQPASSQFPKQSPEKCMMNNSPWQASPPGVQSVRPAPGTPINPNSSACETSSSALEPLILSQPYDHRSVSSGDGPLSAGPRNPSSSHPFNMQSSMSQYGDGDSYDSLCPQNAYYSEERGDSNPNAFRLDATHQPWSSAIH